MNDSKYFEISRLVSDILIKQPMLSKDVRNILVEKGFDEKEVRSCITRMWDSGELNVGKDHLLYSTYEFYSERKTNIEFAISELEALRDKYSFVYIEGNEMKVWVFPEYIRTLITERINELKHDLTIK